MIGIGTPRSQSRIPRPITTSLSWCLRNVQFAFAFRFQCTRSENAIGFTGSARNPNRARIGAPWGETKRISDTLNQGCGEALVETNLSEGFPMPAHECSFLDDNNQIVRTETFYAPSDLDARREVMIRMTRVGGFSRYELWVEGSHSSGRDVG
jgi:hypothetical protein